MARLPAGRQPLLDAARAELVERRGTVELAALARRAELSVGAVYHHFGSKAGLLVAVYDRFYDGLIEAIADDKLAAERGWFRRERHRTQLFVDYHFVDPLAEILLGGLAPDSDLAGVEAAYIAKLSVAASENISRGQRGGEIDTAIDADAAGAYVIGGLRHGIAEQLRRSPRPDPTGAADVLWRLVEATLTHS